MIKANDPTLKSWIDVAKDSHFPIQNIPFGIFKAKDHVPRVATRIGDMVIDLGRLADLGFFDDLDINLKVFDRPCLNDFIKEGKPVWRKVRQAISDIFVANNPKLRDDNEARLDIMYHVHDVELLLPVKIGDYTDFYSSREHATNVGIMFRGKENALMPNWLHLPVAYHGRSSSIVASNTPIHRPKGQILPPDSNTPVYGASRLFDFELEMGFITGQGKSLGQSISTAEADDYIFGLVLFNDLSARDIQKWEYVPLGPFLGKNFGSVMSHWIVTLDALEPFRCAAPKQEPPVLPYLTYEEDNKAIDIYLEAQIKIDGHRAHTISRSNFKYMYWTIEQQLAHHTINGCNINAGDLLASGTLSGPTPDSYGSMLELSWRGTKPLSMPDGSERKFLQDGDTIILRGYCEKDGVRVGFGVTRTKILPALD